MNKTPLMRQPLLRSVVALGCAAMLSACGSLLGSPQDNRADLDQLLQSAPSASGQQGEASEVRALRGETRQDPKSGLQVDLHPATLAPAAAPAAGPAGTTPASHAPSATQGATAGAHAHAHAAQEAPQPHPNAESRVIVADPALLMRDGAPAVATDEPPPLAENVDPKEAIGAPTDPLRPEDVIDLEDAEANKDLWARIRRGFVLPELESNELVDDHERWYGGRPDYVQRMTERASRYLYHIVDEVERRQMPMELALLPFIESAFNPQAMSSARASGMWQFMPATGKDFELKQNLFRDDRRDVLASTRAALDYLSRLYRQFGDWHLALAAYNWGEGNVQRAIKRNERRGLPTDYASLNMPLETRHYVPKLHAVRNIVRQPEAFNLTLTPIENHPYFVSVPIQRDIDVPLAARLAGLPLDEFKALNPSLNKPVILAAGTPQILLPYDNASLFAHKLGEYKGGPLATWTAWVVSRTMRPVDVAKKVGMSEATLREVNRIPPRMLIKAGSALLVHRSTHGEYEDVSEALADNAMMALAPDMPQRRKSFKAGKRDTVASVARRYRVSAEQVAQWNHTSASASFKRGQTVVVYVAGKGGKKMAAKKSRRTVADGAKRKGGKRAVATSSRRETARAGGKPRSSRAAKVRMASSGR